jgi:acyl-ACP thioesterase
MCDHQQLMSLIAGATEFLPPPQKGRRFTSSRPVRLGDVDPSAGLRLDATARYLQDVASDDAADCGLDESLGWVVRRSLIDVQKAAVLDEVVELTTYCTGMGRSWAERTTTIRGSSGAVIDSVNLWVQISVDTGRPTPLSEQFHQFFGEACGDRKVSARLGLEGPSTDVQNRSWAIRRTDLDPFDHVNNAANWSFLEEVVEGPASSRTGRAEMEFLAPIEFGAQIELQVHRDTTSAYSAWLVADSSVYSAARWLPSP